MKQGLLPIFIGIAVVLAVFTYAYVFHAKADGTFDVTPLSDPSFCNIEVDFQPTYSGDSPRYSLYSDAGSFVGTNNTKVNDGVKFCNVGFWNGLGVGDGDYYFIIINDVTRTGTDCTSASMATCQASIDYTIGGTGHTSSLFHIGATPTPTPTPNPFPDADCGNPEIASRSPYCMTPDGSSLAVYLSVFAFVGTFFLTVLSFRHVR